MNLLLSMMITLSFCLMMLNHPLSMGFILIIQTLITAMIMGMMMKSFLFSYIIIIIMLSGVLVLFIYMASVASNEKFNTPIMIIPVMLIIMGMTYLSIKLTINVQINSVVMNESISLIKLFNSLTAKLTLIIIIYLLLTMIVTSFIAKVTEGPLRMKIYE
nr:NADH dehydrogenase subunit 6 [Eysarcoris gibbosus]